MPFDIPCPPPPLIPFHYEEETLTRTGRPRRRAARNAVKKMHTVVDNELDRLMEEEDQEREAEEVYVERRIDVILDHRIIAKHESYKYPPSLMINPPTPEPWVGTRPPAGAEPVPRPNGDMTLVTLRAQRDGVVMQDERVQGSEGEDSEGNDLPPDEDNFCVAVLVKWHESAHIHATWELTTHLSHLRSYRRVEQYLKEVDRRGEILHSANLGDLDYEEEEALEALRIVMENEAAKRELYVQPERIITRRKEEDLITEFPSLEGVSYCVKWKGLDYEHCTYELYEDLQKLMDPTDLKEMIERYRWRSSAVPRLCSQDHQHYGYSRKAFTPLTSDPPFIGLHTMEKTEEALEAYRNQQLGRMTLRPSGGKVGSGKVNAPRTVEGDAEDSDAEDETAAATTAEGEKAEGEAEGEKKEEEVEEEEEEDPHAPLHLKPYQLDGLNYLLHRWSHGINSILADEMGLGKTIQTVTFISCLLNIMRVPGPFLVVVPLSTIPNWIFEFDRWCPDMNVVAYVGNRKSREIIRKTEFNVNMEIGGKTIRVPKFHVLLTTYTLATKLYDELSPFKWRLIAVDEAHRLKNDDSALFHSLSSLDVEARLLVTGTPMQNSLKELWALLRFLHPERFLSGALWDAKYSTEGSSLSSERVMELQSKIKPYMLRRVKADVEKGIPPKMERMLRVGLSPLQKEFYKYVLKRNYSELSKGSKGHRTSLLNIVSQLKKVCNHPYLFEAAREHDPWEDNSQATELRHLIQGSGKMTLLDKLLDRLKADGHRVLVFSQSVMMLNVLERYCKLKQFASQRLDGGTSSEHRRESMLHFNAKGSEDFVFLLSTRAGGLGINLATADTVVIFDSDWNPQNDLQAMARAHRIGQKKSVNIYRFVTAFTVEEEILERAKRKMVLDHVLIQSLDGSEKAKSTIDQKELRDVLRFGTEALFKSSDDASIDQSGVMENVDLDEILNRAEICEVGGDHLSTKAKSFLSAFNVQNLVSDTSDFKRLGLTHKANLDKQGEATVQGVQSTYKPRTHSAVDKRANMGDKDFWEDVLGPEEEDEEQYQTERGGRRARRSRNYHGDDDDTDYEEHHAMRKHLPMRATQSLIKRITTFASFHLLDKIIDHPRIRDRFPTGDSVRPIVEKILQTAQQAVAMEKLDVIGKGSTQVAVFTEWNGVKFNAAEMVRNFIDMGNVYEYVKDESFRLSVSISPPIWCSEWGFEHDTELLLRIKEVGFSPETELYLDVYQNPKKGNYAKRRRAVTNALRRHAAKVVGATGKRTRADEDGPDGPDAKRQARMTLRDWLADSDEIIQAKPWVSFDKSVHSVQRHIVEDIANDHSKTYAVLCSCMVKGKAQLLREIIASETDVDVQQAILTLCHSFSNKTRDALAQLTALVADYSAEYSRVFGSCNAESGRQGIWSCLVDKAVHGAHQTNNKAIYMSGQHLCALCHSCFLMQRANPSPDASQREKAKKLVQDHRRVQVIPSHCNDEVDGDLFYGQNPVATAYTLVLPKCRIPDYVDEDEEDEYSQEYSLGESELELLEGEDEDESVDVSCDIDIDSDGPEPEAEDDDEDVPMQDSYQGGVIRMQEDSDASESDQEESEYGA
ncbi:hypothetical protein KIPB_003633 [Kipferlia bialata]|uniref:Uncharacterized protein n=2 Tax=Kipferlia bialata TaxID=797122 RepID=A0A9K3GEY8_9EUKA|nr:hypothetical protein KIPB_002442 [Kipferlia bialata]GIQ82483.1 hypothetical protein KIPB_003633 [Kipferlia bialata]|eukprot:g2442.t1